jgi:predicted  nucleic acid-binding Zn-ribbon protein
MTTDDTRPPDCGCPCHNWPHWHGNHYDCPDPNYMKGCPDCDRNRTTTLKTLEQLTTDDTRPLSAEEEAEWRAADLAPTDRMFATLDAERARFAAAIKPFATVEEYEAWFRDSEARVQAERARRAELVEAAGRVLGWLDDREDRLNTLRDYLASALDGEPR